MPVGQRVRVEVEGAHGHHEEEKTRGLILTDPRSTFVVWHHGALGHLVRGFPISNREDVPEQWPDDRFDMIWVLRREPADAEYVFSSVDQRLLSGDVGTDT